MRKKVEGKQLKGKKFESKKRRLTFTAHSGPGDLELEVRASQGNAAVKELAPDRSDNTFTKSELVRVEALVQQRAFERRRAQPNEPPHGISKLFSRGC